MTVEKFLEFQGKKITLVNQDGSFYVALKPICEVLQLDWDNERKRLEKHGWLGSTTVNITVVAADGKQREMVCLPEKFIYGWLCNVNPKSEAHMLFQRECYEVLYNHFHNIINTRLQELNRRQQLKDEYQALHRFKLETDTDYQRMQAIEQTLKQANKSLQGIDTDLLGNQLAFNFPAN